MPTRPVESTHEAEPNREVPDPKAAGVESSSADSPTQPKAATAQPRRRSPGVEGPEAGRMQGANGLPLDSNADDATSGDQDIDTAGTAHDDLSPTKSM
jgi:hypothetical protein